MSCGARQPWGRPCDVLAFDNAHLTRDSVKMPTAATSIEGTMHEIGTFTVSEGETRKNEEVFPAKIDHQAKEKINVVERGVI